MTSTIAQIYSWVLIFQSGNIVLVHMKHSAPLHFEDQQTKTLQDDQLAHAQPVDINQCHTSKLVIKYSVKETQFT